MSDKQQLANARTEVDSLIQSGAKISLANKDTFYLYSTDKKLLATIDLYKDGKSEPEYTILVNGLPETRKFHKSNKEYKNLYNYINRIYNFDSMLGQNIDKTPFTLIDAQKMWNKARAHKSIEQEQKFLNELVHNLIQRKCPIDLIQRVFYCFEVPRKKSVFPKNFTMLNIPYKLVEYRTSRNNLWFYTGQNSTGRFIEMDNESQQLFDVVKIALKKQKQNVK